MQVEVNLINGKLLARTEDGWNWGKYADIGKSACSIHVESGRDCQMARIVLRLEAILIALF